MTRHKSREHPRIQIPGAPSLPRDGAGATARIPGNLHLQHCELTIVESQVLFHAQADQAPLNRSEPLANQRTSGQGPLPLDHRIAELRRGDWDLLEETSCRDRCHSRLLAKSLSGTPRGFRTRLLRHLRNRHHHHTHPCAPCNPNHEGPAEAPNDCAHPAAVPENQHHMRPSPRQPQQVHCCRNRANRNR